MMRVVGRAVANGLLGWVLVVGAAAQDVTPVIHVANPPNTVEQQAKHYVVMVSLDGFRYNYPAEYGAPHLAEMAKDGASAPNGMVPSYPSVTFPNHYTLVTGLRPEHNGLVANGFLDPERNASYNMSDAKATTDGSWYSGTPLWVLAEQQGMRSACFFWPGSEAAIDGVRPSFYLHYDEGVNDNKRIDQVIAWLNLPPEQRPHFITLYYPDTDHAGHKFGPDSPETGDAVHHVDKLMGTLREKLKATGLPVDLIVVADHGMVVVNPTPVVLDQYAKLDHFQYRGEQLYAPSEAAAEKAYEEFRAHPDPRFTAYRRKDVPAELFYNENPREGDPVIVANGPYAIEVHARPDSGRGEASPVHGSHGFDPRKVPEMKAIFFAEGPDIQPDVALPSFDNVDVYPFVAKLLGLTPPPVDGVLGPLEKALKK